MVSALWTACSAGELENVQLLLNDASPQDLEIRDPMGATPLIEAVKNGHVEVVRLLLDKGADPHAVSSHGRPEQLTSDPAILELLHNVHNKLTSSGLTQPESGFSSDDPSKRFYPPPPGPYAYYPAMPPAPVNHDGTMAYYQPPPPPLNGEQPSQGGPGNLPPPEIARLIPCRYFPACRYGPSCIFAHPQGPYYQSPMPPPGQYPAPYDPLASQAYQPNYYPVPPPSYQPQPPPPNGVPSHLTPMSPQSGPHQASSPVPSMVHARSASEAISPPQGPFSAPPGPPPMPYGAMSPGSYPHPGPVPLPMSVPPLPPLHQQPPQQGPQSPNMYHNPSQPGAVPPPFAMRQDAPPNGYAQMPQGSYVDGNAHNGPKSPPLHPQGDNFIPGPGFRDGSNHNRRGSGRRGSFGGNNRKPPCLFFPSGRCRNGDECRFPHVMPENQVIHPYNNHNNHMSGRGGHRQRPSGHYSNGFNTIEEKMTNMQVRDDGFKPNGVEGSSRSQSTEAGSRSRYSQGQRNPNHAMNGVRLDKRVSTKQQRVPNDDDFPLLAGSNTPPLRSPGLNGSLPNGHAGPTAAQVLSAPPPARRESAKASVAGSSNGDLVSADKDNEPTSDAHASRSETSHDSSTNKIPVTFASIATPAPTADAGKEVSVSA